jgi:hypothetical protein
MDKIMFYSEICLVQFLVEFFASGDKLFSQDVFMDECMYDQNIGDLTDEHVKLLHENSDYDYDYSVIKPFATVQIMSHIGSSKCFISALESIVDASSAIDVFGDCVDDIIKLARLENNISIENIPIKVTSYSNELDLDISDILISKPGEPLAVSIITAWEYKSWASSWNGLDDEGWDEWNLLGRLNLSEIKKTLKTS